MITREQKYRKSEELVGKHRGETIIVAGTAPSLTKVDFEKLRGRTVIGCNAILRTKGFDPSIFGQFYLMLSDRRVYLREHKMVAKIADKYPVLLSTTIWDGKVKCGGAVAPARPAWKFYPWRVGTCRNDFNWTNFTWPLCSCATIVGPMIQAAAIMGAKRIGAIGVDMQMPKTGVMHSYEDGGAGRKEATIHEGSKLGAPITHRLLAETKRVLKKRGVAARNISAVKDTVFATLWGHEDMGSFLAHD